MIKDLEIPLGKKTVKYRFFEMLPAIISYGMVVLMVVLSIINPTIAAIYLFLMVLSMLVKAAAMAYRTIQGRNILDSAQKVDWHERLMELSDPGLYYDKHKDHTKKEFNFRNHLFNLQKIASEPSQYPKPNDIYQAIIIATYNESYEVLEPTIQSVLDTTYDKDKIILVMAYEKRGGPEIKRTIERLQKKFGNCFFAFHTVEHPDNLPNEVQGKGGNITYAGYFLKDWLVEKSIDSNNVVVTTLDADNKPYKSYFDYLSYEFIIRKDRNNFSYQPICLFTSNIWDAPAPMRVIATGNSFWNIISSLRPHTLRNFASHSQPMKALEGMGFWSKRTIVEDGHQYWRSYFYFKGDYRVAPIYVPIYQDAVLSDTYLKTFKAQFIQLRRWDYGASDVAYVANKLFSRSNDTPFFKTLLRFINLLDGYVTLAGVSILVAVGGWIPLLVNSSAQHSVVANQLPDTVGYIQSIAVIGVLITVFCSFKLLPPRPERYKKRRSVWMALQWVMMPITAIFFGSFAALNSQGRLFLGRYLDKFDVTEKAVRK